MRELYEFGNPSAPNVLIQMVDDHDLEAIATEVKTIQTLSGADFCLRAIKVLSWNHDLSPWKAPAVFGNEDFGFGAEAMLAKILPMTVDKEKKYYIGGYSLAGLFALWAAYQTDVFSGVAAASPSVWFPGFVDYMQNHEIQTGMVYLSLGDREERTRNAVMATVGEKIRESYALLAAKGILCALEWNQGNHFKDSEIRTAKAFSWLLTQNNAD